MSVDRPADPNILYGANAWLEQKKSATDAMGFEYGATEGHDGTTDTDPENGYLEIDCAWLVKRGLEKAGYSRPTISSIKHGLFSWYFYRLDPSTDNIGAGDIISMASIKNPHDGHVGIIETFSEYPLGGYYGDFFHSSYSAPPQIIWPNGGAFWWVYGPGPHDGTFVDDPDWLYPSFDIIDSRAQQFITGYWRPRDIPLRGPDEEEEEEGEVNYLDPLIVNLDGAGIRTVGLDQEVYFDHDANGFQELSGWVSAGSGFLMVDWNGNGQLDTGRELFWRQHHSSRRD